MSSVRPRRLVALLVVSAVAVLMSLLVSGTAQAEAPFRLPTQIVDPAGALSDVQRAAVERTVADLSVAQDLDYWVVYVKNFDGKSPAEWTANTVSQSDFGARDVVLAIATEQRASYLHAPLAVDGLTEGEIAAITADTLAPDVAAGRFAEAAISVGQALESAASDDDSSSVLWPILFGAGALALIAAVAFAVYRGRRTPAPPAESLTVDELGHQPLAELHSWSREALTSADRAVGTSADELTLAISEVGSAATWTFTQAVVSARSTLAGAFAVRQQLDDGLITSEDEQRTALVTIITAASDADASLDGQVTSFDTLRDLRSTPTERLDALAARSATLAGRIPAASARLGDLVTEHGADAAVVADNVHLARALLSFADDAIAQGRDAATDRTDALVGTIRSAEGALDQVGKLLDSVDAVEPSPTADLDLPTVIDRIQAVTDFVMTRRGAVGAVARTRLSEARRIADMAADLAESDSDESAIASATASRLAEESLAAALDDAGTRIDDESAPVLAGVLVDSVLPASVHAGGFTHGGRSPASFGGSAQAGRIGIGGRT